MKAKKKKTARDLRKQGLSLGHISSTLSVSRSSVSRWVSDIILTKQQKDFLKSRSAMSNKASDRHRQKRLKYQQEGRARAKDGDLFHAMNCMLYWAEGNKDQVACRLSNTDVFMLKMFVSFLRKEFNTTNNKFKISTACHLNNNLSVVDIENYWLVQLDLPRSCLRKHTIKSDNKNNKVGKHPYGLCNIGVYDVKIVQHIYGAIQEYAGFDNNYCLDVLLRRRQLTNINTNV